MTAPTRPGDALSDTQRRFLAAVMERLPRESIHQIYLFAPMRQGGVETGIAVVAMDEVRQLDVGPTATLPAEGGPAEAGPAEAGPSETGPAETGPSETGPSETGPSETGPSETGPSETGPSETGPSDHATGNDGRPLRYTVHTARYRLQLKGPDRGRWDFDVVEEADAPQVSVDAVVRGVHRRSGEPFEVERLAPHDLARALGEIPWTSEN